MEDECRQSFEAVFQKHFKAVYGYVAFRLTGFRGHGQFYTDPAIVEMDFDIIRKLGMNGMWDQGGLTRQMARQRGIDRSTLYWRAIAFPPRDAEVGGVRLDWSALES